MQRLQNERGRGSQRGEPQHAGDEQQRDLAHLPAADRRLTHRLTEHPVPQRANRVDLNQCHSQSGQSMQDIVHAFVKGVMHAGDTLICPRRGQNSSCRFLPASSAQKTVVE